MLDSDPAIDMNLPGCGEFGLVHAAQHEADIKCKILLGGSHHLMEARKGR